MATEQLPNVYDSIATLFGVSQTVAIVIFAIITIWSLVWKGLALWKSARKNSLIWFIALLIINTVGILEILYIFIFSKMGGKSKKKNKSSKKK